MKKTTTYLLILILLLSAGFRSLASHIVGGEVTYVCEGGGYYRITVIVYRDCIGGIVGAISEDNPAFISIFDGNGGRVVSGDSISMNNVGGTIIPPDFKNDCVNNPPRTCLNSATFSKRYYLPPNTTGYKVVYQRCCRNASIVNLVDPSATGATYFCLIPPAGDALCNNSAIFQKFPPQIICVNNPLVYDHRAIDPDGDSLSYEFCQAYDGGSNSNPKPIPLNRYDPVTYRPPYNSARPMGGSPQIQINPRTGLITGTPTQQGRYVVTVCCSEWRRGVKINTVTREFQFVVTNCSKAVVADIPQLSTDYNTYIINCKDYTVDFINLSQGGSTYHWDFGVTTRADDTSAEFQPTYVYPDSGTFVVTLYVNKGSTCSDSISRFVKVYPKLVADFSYPSEICPGDTVQFSDLTTSTYPINKWHWVFDDGSPADSRQHPGHTFPYGGLYTVGMASSNVQGCTDTVFKKVLVDPVRAFAGNDTVIIKGDNLGFQAYGGTDYLWTPSTYLNDPLIANPVGHFTDNGRFSYVLRVRSNAGCVSYDTVNVTVIENPYLDLPSMFTPNGDGLNDRFRPIYAGYPQIKSFKIFNRYGQEVFTSRSAEDSWDGTFAGQALEIGVYFWILEAKDRRGNDIVRKGDVTLLR